MKKIIYLIPLIIIFVLIIILFTKKESSNSKIENYVINNVEDCKKFLPSIKAYCPSLQEIEPQFYEKNAGNPFSESFTEANITLPAARYWFYKELPNTNNQNPLQLFSEAIIGKAISVKINIFDSKSQTENQFGMSLNNSQISFGGVNVPGLQSLQSNLEQISPTYFVIEEILSIRSYTLISSSQIKNKENIIITDSQTFKENETPLCPKNKVKKLIESI